MEKYKNIVYKESFTKVLNYKNHFIFDIFHSVERYKERVGNNMSLYYNLLQKGIDWIIANKKEDDPELYIFISNKYGFGIQVEWRQDRNPKIKNLNGYSATTFSKKEMNVFTKADKQIILEQLKLSEGVKRAKDIVNKGFAFFEFDEELDEELYLIHCDKFIEQGKIYCTYKIVNL